MLKREANCPLCGARMPPHEWLDAATGITNTELGVLSAQCPYCQGHLEIQPDTDRIDLGYCVGNTSVRFEIALSMPYEGLRVCHSADRSALIVDAGSHHWEYTQAED